MDEWEEVRKQIRILEETGGSPDPLSEVSRLSVADYWKRKFDDSKRQWEEELARRDRDKVKLREGYREEEKIVFELGARLREMENRIEWERLLWEEKYKVKAAEADFDRKKNEAELRIKAAQQENDILKKRLSEVSESLQSEQLRRQKIESDKYRFEEAYKSLEAKMRESGSEDRVKVQFLERERDSLQRRIDALQIELAQAHSVPLAMMPMLSLQGNAAAAEIEKLRKQVQAHEKEAEFFAVREKDRLQAVEDIAKGFAHKVRNYLSIIGGTIQLCLDGDPKEKELKDQLVLIDANAQEMFKTVEELLTFTQVPALNLEKVSAADLLEIGLGASAEAVKNAGASVEKEIPDSLPPLNADSAMIKEAIRQIMDNAAEASSSGQKIHVSARQDPDSGLVHFIFADQGKGVDESLIPKLFKPYFTGKKGKKGLGLFMARRAADLHHGTVKFESVKGSGSRVTLSLPAAKA